MKQVEEIGFAAVLFVAFAIFVTVGWGYSEIPRTVPLTVSIPGLVIAGVQLVKLLRNRRSLPEGSGDLDLPMALPDASEEAVGEMVRSAAPEAGELGQGPPMRPTPKTRRILAVWAWIAALAAGIDLLGFLVATPIFLFAFIRFVGRRSWVVSAVIAASFTVIMYLVFYVGLQAQL